MKNTRKKMLLSSVAMLLVALVALGSATYAWFTINKVVEANSIKVQANVAKGLVISNTQTADWKRTVSYSGTATELTPVSILISKASSGTAIDTTKGPGTPYYAQDVTADGALTSGSAKGFSAASYPTGNKVTGATALTYNDNGYVAAYTMQVAASDGTINKAVTASIEVASTSKATGAGASDPTGSDFAKAALVKDGKVIGFYTDGAYTAIKGPGDDPSTETTAAAKISDIAALSTVPAKTSAATFTLYVWYEGNDEHCTNGGQGAQTNFTVKYTLAS